MPSPTYAGYLNDMVTRIAACLNEYFTAQGVSNFVADSNFPALRTVFPYVTIRVGARQPDLAPVTEDEFKFIRGVEIRLVADHITAGYAGESGALTYEYMEYVEDCIRSVDFTMLMSATYPTAPTWLHPLGARLASDTGLIVIQNAGVADVRQLGCLYTLNVYVQKSNY